MCWHVVKKNLTLAYKLTLLILLFAVKPGMADAEMNVRWSAIQNPYVKEVLFDLYSDKPFMGINRLITLRSFYNLEDEQVDIDSLLGALYLAYGMPREALQIFSAMADKGVTSPTLDTLWFYLAKAFYERQEIPAAQTALSQIQGELDDNLERDRMMLTALLLMQQNKSQAAEEALNQLLDAPGWSAFARYNLGVVMAKSGRAEDSIKLWDYVAKIDDGDQEMLALKDKANVTLGYYFLRNQNPTQAKNYLQDVRLDSPLANKALLGLGWTYSALDKQKTALVAWLELSERNKSDKSVLEALLAIPYAFGNLQAYGQSLDNYEKALNTFTAETKRIDSLIEYVRNEDNLRELLRQSFTHLNENSSEQKIPIPILSNVSGREYMIPFFSSNEFQLAQRNYQDLVFLSNKLQSWMESIDHLHGISQTFRESYMDRVVKQQKETLKAIAELEEYISSLAVEHLEAQKRRISNYVGQARFAMAKIYDQAARIENE